jgi:hypothetical protein
MATIVTAGRTDLDDYFTKGDFATQAVYAHTPLLVFLEGETEVTIKLIGSREELLHYPDETKVMGQWRGKGRSDFFQYTVGQARAAWVKEKERLAKLGIRSRWD